MPLHQLDEDRLVVRAIEDRHRRQRRCMQVMAPQEVVRPLLRGRNLERPDVDTGRVHFVQNGADRAILAGGVHALQDNQQRVGPGGVQQLLKLTELLDQRVELHFAGFFGDVAVAPSIDGGEIDRLTSVAAERVSHASHPESRHDRLAVRTPAVSPDDQTV